MGKWEKESRVLLFLFCIEISLWQATEASRGPKCGYYQGCSPNPMAFHANLRSTLNIQDIYKEETVVYDDVILNVGNGYDSQTGIFTCKKAGLYSFSWTSMTLPGKRFETRFILNEKRIAGNRANAVGIDQFVQGTKTVVIEMREGDTAKINTIKEFGSAESLYGDHNSFTSFSGIKVDDLKCDEI